jgi:hypothetical protein
MGVSRGSVPIQVVYWVGLGRTPRNPATGTPNTERHAALSATADAEESLSILQASLRILYGTVIRDFRPFGRLRAT